MKNPFRRDPDPFALNRYGDLLKSGRERERHPLRSRWKLIALVLAGLLMGTGVTGYLLVRNLEGDIQDEDLGGSVDPRADPLDPFNVLLVGSDSREGLTEEEQHAFGADAVPGERADTLILAHIDPVADTVIMVQFPRDLYVPLATGGSGKINSALETGRVDLVRTIEDLSGLEINHYAQINIAGFRDLVDAIDGVDVCVTEPIPFDSMTGIEITPDEVGMVHFDGERALRFVRSRNFPTGDFDRIANQQKFLSAAIDKITSVGTFFSPGRIRALYRSVGDNLRVDPGTGIGKLLDIAGRMQDFDPKRYEAYIVPNLGTATNEAGSVVLPDDDAMQILFKAIADNASPAEADGVPDIDPATIRVGVYNGTTTEGAAGEAAGALEDATRIDGRSIDIAEVANARHLRFRRTIVEYEPRAEPMARLVAAAIPGAVLRAGSTGDSIDVAVIVGRRFRVEPIVQILAIPLPPPAALPEECR